MREKHLTYFKVENFKRFEQFELNDIGQFNLLVGDNNVGKTSVLESLLFDENPKKVIRYIDNALTNRKILIDTGANVDLLKFYYNTIDLKYIKYKYDTVERKGNTISMRSWLKDELPESIVKNITTKLALSPKSKHLIEFIVNGIEDYEFSNAVDGDINNYAPLIGYGMGYGEDLVEFYSKSIQNSTKAIKTLLSDLHLFIPEAFYVESQYMEETESQMLVIREMDKDMPLPLSMYGEGAIKLFRILVEISMCKGERLMIDEVDTGIHWSRFKLFWKTIINAAIRNDVQLFATTHNIECLEYFKQALEDEDMKQYQNLARHYTLLLNSDKQVEAVKSNFEQFEFALEHNINIRGGK